MTATKRKLPDFAQDILRAGPPRAGEGVHIWLYRTARVLHPYRDSDAIARILEGLTQGCGRVVTRREIEDAVRNSKAAAWQPEEGKPPRTIPAWPKVNPEQREAVIATAEGFGLVDLWEGSPVRFEDNQTHTEEVIDVLLPDNPFLCCGRGNSDFSTWPRATWRGKLAGMQFIVPSPMTAKTGRTQDGKESEHTLANTGPRRFLIVEQDGGTLDEQAAVLAHLAGRAPLAMVVHSGNKSLHGWFYCAGQAEERLRRFMRHAAMLGADRATWTRSQFVRMPDGIRDNGNRQAAYFFNPEVLK